MQINTLIKTGERVILTDADDGDYIEAVFIQYSLNYTCAMVKTDTGLQTWNCSSVYPISKESLLLEQKSRL